MLAGAVLLAACAPVPRAPAPGTGTLWGYVHAVPRAGVTPGRRPADSYADRRLRDVEFVDYRRPGFAVVYVEGEPPPAGNGRLIIEGSLLGARFAPAYAAVGVGGRVVLRNADWVAHTVSCPSAGFLHRLAPGEEGELPTRVSGAAPVFLLDAPRVQGLLFVSPGPYAVASPEGRWELPDLPPGPRRLHAWHPRLPPGSSETEVQSGRATRVDLDVGVGNLDLHEQTP